MTNTLLNIAGKIDADTVSIYRTVKQAAVKLEMPFVVVGASARDLVLHHYYGAKIQRATIDIDFGVQVPNWTAFKTLKQKLIEENFKETTSQHRMLSPQGMPVDIIPFGPLQDGDANISWPPRGEEIMNVLGFQEACDHPVIVRIQYEPSIDIPVAAPQGMALLKFIAWINRGAGNRIKDAKDLCYLLSAYEEIPAISEGMYEDEKLMAAYDWDNRLAGAYLLGKDARKIASEKTWKVIQSLFAEEIGSLRSDRLVEEMCANPERDFKRNSDLLAAFMRGFSLNKH